MGDARLLVKQRSPAMATTEDRRWRIKVRLATGTLSAPLPTTRRFIHHDPAERCVACGERTTDVRYYERDRTLSLHAGCAELWRQTIDGAASLL
jgi:hypothetical protein